MDTPHLRLRALNDRRMGLLCIAAMLVTVAGCEVPKVAAPTPTAGAGSSEAPRTTAQGTTASAPVDPVVEVVTAPVEFREVDEWIEVAIELVPYRRTFPAAEASGRVTAVNFEVGDVVKDGAVLVQVDDSIAKLEVARDESALERGKVLAEECSVALGKAERDLSRMEALADGGQASEGELDASRVEVAAARSRVAQARNEVLALESTVRASRRNVERMAVKAPFSGIVVAKRTELGGWVDAGTVLAEIEDVATLEAKIRVPESLLYSLKAAESKARVRVPFAGVEVESPVLRIVRSVTGSERCFDAYLRLDNKDVRLVPGMKATCLVATGKKVERLTIPLEAVSPGIGGEPDMFCVVEHGTASWTPFKHWYAVDGRAVVGESWPGLRDVRVVIDGMRLIPHDGSRPSVKERSPAQQADSPQPKLDSRKPE
jgi:RND family efflux transporter MFP subunit